ncbi:ATP-binding protein [Endozoicomonas sp. OPT23]|uniref:ATP-binding protein n=1 Tax=Endozoicomonas sp. OPT23 TaxID=2072845 RepID=UPI00129A4EA0|nr:ATP-binding protein [Endozoicomonas sp. OPT23]MRI31376.1 ATP-binding protein [Endozoicomonas sp. OPT23]
MIKAVYSDSFLPEYKGNPLIEALPKKESMDKVIKTISNFPSYSKSERNCPSYEREDYVARLTMLRQPLPEYLQCFRIIDRFLKESYSSKNPLLSTTAHYLHYIEYSKAPEEPRAGLFHPRGSAATIVGPSGVGKTKMLLQVLDYYPQVIVHEEYDGKQLSIKQVVWLKVECPFDASIRGFCHAILSAMDSALESEETKPQKTLDALLTQIERKIRSSFVGVIVIDEMQNVSITNAGGYKKLLAFLLNLINRSGVPIVFCGNPEMIPIFKRKFKIARRLEAGGYIQMEAMEPSVWKLFMRSMWKYQWTNIVTPLSEGLMDKLYDLSEGIIDIAIRIYMEAQEIVIGSNDEKINIDVLEKAYQNVCPFTDKGLSLLKTADENLIRSIYDDILNDDDCSWLQQNSMIYNEKPHREECNNAKLNENSHCKSKSKMMIKGDLSRPHHQEFESAIYKVINCDSLDDVISNPTLLRNALDEDDVISYLYSKDILINDPLNQIGV